MKPIKGYEGLYSITESGDVISHPKKWVTRERYLKPNINNGYQYVGLCKDGVVTVRPVHQLMGEVFLIKNHQEDLINHKDGNKSNNNIDNLEYVSRSENMKHSYRCLGRKSPAYYKGKTGFLHNKSRDFYLKDLDGNTFHYGSGEEFQRITGFSAATISYQRNTKKNSHTFIKGRLVGYTVYFSKP